MARVVGEIGSDGALCIAVAEDGHTSEADFSNSLRDALNVQRATTRVIYLNHRAVQHHAVLRHLESLGHIRDETLDDGFDLATEHTFVWSGESRIAQIRRAAREDLFIRSLNVCMCSDDRADRAVHHPSERNLL